MHASGWRIVQCAECVTAGVLMLLGCTSDARAPGVQAPRAAGERGVPSAPVRSAAGTTTASTITTTTTSASTSTSTSMSGTDAVLTVTDPDALAVVAREMGDFGMLVVGRTERGASNRVLADDAAYRSFADVVVSEIDAVARADGSAGVGIAAHPHRLFDVRWLRAESARFELIALVNRIDRRPFDETVCGETPFVYRLAYAANEGGARLASRLPMTVIAELRGAAAAPDDCRAAAARWLAPRGLHGRELGAWLVGDHGPISRTLVNREHLIQLGVNVQSVRWPSAVRPDLAGHAEYLLRAFSWDGASQRYVPRKLENTPDVARLRKDARLRPALLEWLTAPEHAAGIDTATARIPDEFLALSALSVTPRGMARRQNRPYRSLFEPSAFAALPFTQLRFARSPEAFVRRLDDLSCNGCHQSRSIAGFHLVGEDGSDAAPGNALASALSPHAHGELERRRAYLLALARGEHPDDARPFAERAANDPGGYGAHCGLGDPGFAAWSCAPGLECDAYEAPVSDTTVGVCLPHSPRVGNPCERGRVQPNADPHRDRVRTLDPRPCQGVCEASSVGFPGGMCAASCDALPSDAACGGIAILTDFNACLARREPFTTCVANHVRPAGLRACSTDAPCRDDYICAQGQTTGVCLPPYFVFQLRVDGHP